MPLTGHQVCAHTNAMRELVACQRTSTAAPARYFQRWIDHATWPQWSPDTTWARVDGPVQTGARGTLKPRGGPKTTFVVSEYHPDQLYTDVSRVPGATLTFRHAVDVTEAGTRLTVTVWLDGPLSGFWARTAFRKFATSVPADLDRLITLVEAG